MIIDTQNIPIITFDSHREEFIDILLQDFREWEREWKIYHKKLSNKQPMGSVEFIESLNRKYKGKFKVIKCLKNEGSETDN